MPDGLDIFIVLTILSRTFKGDLREKESAGHNSIVGREVSLPVSPASSRMSTRVKILNKILSNCFVLSFPPFIIILQNAAYNVKTIQTEVT